MSYDEDLAFRLRALLADVEGLEEKPMFGGLAFLVGGAMAIAASREGGLLVRVAPERTAALLSRAHTAPFVMRGREMDGWLRVSAEGCRTRRALAGWVTIGVATARALPPRARRRG